MNVIEYGFFLAKVPNNEFDECFDWCFGNHARSIRILELHNEWNLRHKDIFEMQGSDIVIESMKRAGSAYLINKNK